MSDQRLAEVGQITRKIFSLSSLSVVTMLSPFILLPVVARYSSIDGWASFAVGQSVGAVGGAAILFSLSLSGPTEAARARGPGLLYLFNDSLIGRGAIALVVLPACWLVSVAIVSSEGGLAAATAVGLAFSSGFSPGWFFIGTGEHSGLVLFETLPALAATILSAALILCGYPVWLYGVVLVGFRTTSLVWLVMRLNRERVVRSLCVRRALGSLRRQCSLASTQILSSVYSFSPTSIVAVVGSQSDVAGFASADKIFRPAKQLFAASVNAVQAWVSEGEVEDRRFRVRVSILFLSSLGLVGSLMIPFLGGATSQFLFGVSLRASIEVLVPFGVAFLAVSLHSCTGRILLIPGRNHRIVLISTVIGGAFGITVMIVGGVVYGQVGVVWGLAISELIVLVVQLPAAFRAWRMLDLVNL